MIAKYVVICSFYSKKSTLTRFKRLTMVKIKGFILLLLDRKPRLNG